MAYPPSKYTGAEVEALLDQVGTNKADLLLKAPLWNTSGSYSEGDYVVHNGYLWVCSSANSGTEPGIDYNVWNVTYSNPNLLDNPWFTVNQRGQSKYTGAVYGVDRWTGVYGGEIVEPGDGFGIKCTFDGNQGIKQRIEDIQSLLGKTVTLSVYLPESGTVSATNYLNVYLIATVSGSQTAVCGMAYSKFVTDKQGYFATIGTVPSNATDLSVTISGNTTYTIGAVKLERGITSTLDSDVAPNYAEELLKCQRYYQRFGSTDPICIGKGWSYNTTSGYLTVDLAAPMRTIPSVTGATNLRISSGTYASSWPSVTAVTARTISNNKFTAYFTVSSMTAAAAYSVYVKDSVVFELSADL